MTTRRVAIATSTPGSGVPSAAPQVAGPPRRSVVPQRDERRPRDQYVVPRDSTPSAAAAATRVAHRARRRNPAPGDERQRECEQDEWSKPGAVAQQAVRDDLEAVDEARAARTSCRVERSANSARTSPYTVPRLRSTASSFSQASPAARQRETAVFTSVPQKEVVGPKAPGRPRRHQLGAPASDRPVPPVDNKNSTSAARSSIFICPSTPPLFHLSAFFKDRRLTPDVHDLPDRRTRGRACGASPADQCRGSVRDATISLRSRAPRRPVQRPCRRAGSRSPSPRCTAARSPRCGRSTRRDETTSSSLSRG